MCFFRNIQNVMTIITRKSGNFYRYLRKNIVQNTYRKKFYSNVL